MREEVSCNHNPRKPESFFPLRDLLIEKANVVLIVLLLCLLVSL